MDDAEHTSGADFKGAPSHAAAGHGLENKAVIGFIVAAVVVIAALVYWAM